MHKLKSLLTQPTSIPRSPWLWALLLGIVVFLVFPGASAWQGDQAAIIQAALDANAAGHPATALVRLPASNRLASPAAIWPYQALLLVTHNPIALTFLKNLLLLAALLVTAGYLGRCLEISSMPMLAAILLLPYSWLLLRPLDEAAFALPFAFLAFGATIAFFTEATDHPWRDLLLAIAAALGSAILALQPATPLAMLGIALLRTPPTLSSQRKFLRIAGSVLLVVAAAHFLWLLKVTRSANSIPVGRSLLAMTSALPQFVSSWKLSVQPSPLFLNGVETPLRWLWLAGEYLTYALILLTLVASVIATMMRRTERQTKPLVLGALLAIPSLALHIVLSSMFRQGGLHRDLITALPALLVLLAMGFASLRNYLCFKRNYLYAIILACATLATGCYAARLYILAGDDRPECLGSTLAMQWEVTLQLESYAHSHSQARIFNYARCFQYAPQQLTTLRSLADGLKLPTPEYTPESIHIRQRREGTGLLEVETRY